MQNTPDSMELVLEHSPMQTPRTPSEGSCMSELWSTPDSNVLASSSSGRDPGKANVDASASQHHQARLGEPSPQAQAPTRRHSTAACKMLCRAHWRCIGCFQTRAFCRGLTFLILGALVLHSATQAPVRPFKSKAYEANASLHATATHLRSRKSRRLIGTDQQRHALPASLRHNKLQMVTCPASDCYQVASVQTLITEAASYGPAGHPHSLVTQSREARHAGLSSGAILMKIASVHAVHCSQKRPRTEDSSSIAGGTEVHPHLNNHSPQPSQAGSVHISATWSGLSEPGIEGHSSPGASLSPCFSQGYRLKLPSWMYIRQCCQIHCEGSSSPTGRFEVPTSAQTWPPASCTVCLQHLNLRSSDIWHAARTRACDLRAEVATMDQKRCTCNSRPCFCLRGVNGQSCCAKQPFLAVRAAFDTESYVPVVCIPTAPGRQDRGTCCRTHAMICCLSLVFAHSECTCRSRMVHVLYTTVAGALADRPPWSLVCMPQPSFRCQQALCGQQACLPKVPLTPPWHAVTTAHNRSARWLEGSTSPDQRAALITSIATRSVSRPYQDHAEGDPTHRLREVEASASDQITGGRPTDLGGQLDDWLQYYRLEGSASPCCALPAAWSTRPGPQGQPGQLGPGIRCTMHTALHACGLRPIASNQHRAPGIEGPTNG